MTKLFLTTLGAAIVVALLKFGTIDPCGIVRAEVRQEAEREGGFGGAVAAALPDGVIDSIIAAQYGPLSPGRCIVLALRRTPSQAPAEQQRALEPVRPQAGVAVINDALTKTARAADQTMVNIQSWSIAANDHASKLPKAKARYAAIEDEMSKLIARERVTTNGVARSQISVAITQDDVAGVQTDLQVDQVWDELLRSGNDLARALAEYLRGSCNSSDHELQIRGALPDRIAAWRTGCSAVTADKAQFDLVFGRVIEVRQKLKVFEANAQKRRRALVDESNRLQ